MTNVANLKNVVGNPQYRLQKNVEIQKFIKVGKNYGKFGLIEI